MAELKVFLETGTVHVLTKECPTGADIVNEVTKELHMKPLSRPYFGLCRKMTNHAESNYDWVHLNFPLSPSTYSAALSLRLFLKVRCFPADIESFARQDPVAAKYLVAQIVRELLSGERPLENYQAIVSLTTLEIILHLINDYHEEGKRCSSIDKQTMLAYFDNAYDVESFLSEEVVESTFAQQVVIAVKKELQDKWPMKEERVVLKYLTKANSFEIFGNEQFYCKVATPRARLTQGIAQVQKEQIVLQGSESIGIRFDRLQRILITSGTEMQVIGISGNPCMIEFSNQSDLHNFATQVAANVFVITGRLITEHKYPFVPYGADFGTMDKSKATDLLKKHGLKDGLYLIRVSPNNARNYGLSICCHGEVKPYQIKYFGSGKFGIGTGLHFRTMGELCEHYHFLRDGLSCALVQNVMVYENPNYAQSSVMEKLRNSDIAAFEKEQTEVDRPQPKRTLDDIKINPTSLKLENKIGRGQFGLVHRAHWASSKGKQTVAVKTIISENVAAQEELLKEAQLMVDMNHENLVQILGICDNPIMMVCEYCQYGGLIDYLRSKKNLDRFPAVFPTFMLQIAKGMAYLEKNLFVHRDLAARNVLVADHDLVKVADFGLSRSTQGETNYYTAAERGKWPLKWYAPESINFKRFSSKSDVWSFGITCWEMYKRGQKPYGLMKGPQIIKLIQTGARLPRPEDCPESIFSIVRKCWELETSDRPSFAQIVSQLESLSDDGDESQSLVDDQAFYDAVPSELKQMKTILIDPNMYGAVCTAKNFVDPKLIKLGKVVGSGNFGEVLEGVYIPPRGTPTRVAIKHLHHADADARDNLMKEAEIMGSLKNQYLVALIGISNVSNNLSMITEFLALGSIREFLIANTDFPVEYLCLFTYQISCGMGYMEKNGFVHRDLAARNVLVSSSNLCKLTDFGMSRALNKSSNYYRAKNKGRWPIKWYAPECLYKSKFTSKSDVWSFGITAWEIFSFGVKPYKKMKGQEVMRFLKVGNRLASPALCPKWLHDVMLNCWQWEDTHRPTFQDIVDTMKTRVNSALPEIGYNLPEKEVNMKKEEPLKPTPPKRMQQAAPRVPARQPLVQNETPPQPPRRLSVASNNGPTQRDAVVRPQHNEAYMAQQRRPLPPARQSRN
eukprot:m.96186 g.96186  ORF g.96186 m.96186 type:complete len:1131 (+) comp8963_c0_seq7:40-3432(+)